MTFKQIELFAETAFIILEFDSILDSWINIVTDNWKSLQSDTRIEGLPL